MWGNEENKDMTSVCRIASHEGCYSCTDTGASGCFSLTLYLAQLDTFNQLICIEKQTENVVLLKITVKFGLWGSPENQV